MSIRNSALLFLLILSVLLGGFSLAGTEKVVAYDGGRLIDNGVFLHSGSMDAGQIQNFLSSKGSGLASRSFVLQCYGANSQERQLYNSVGAPCDQSIPASHIIYFASRIYGINPQVILATLQKEQSLITTGNPTDWQLNQAMGYGCPTTGNCSGNSTFSYQIDSGVWALRYHYERANGNNNWWSPSSGWVCGTEKDFYKPNLYPGQNVRFYDENNVHYRTHYLATAATSALYCYTPHAYNNPQGLYGRPVYGTTGMYYSGSYNFVLYFHQWFGSTSSDCIYPATVANGVFRLFNHGTGNQLLTTSPSEVCEATRIGWMYDGQLFTQEDDSPSKPVFRLHNNGRYLFTASTAERDSAVSNYGYRVEGVAFNGVDPSSNPSEARPVYRLASPIGTYLYTISSYERDMMANSGYRYEGVSFYLKENPGAAIIPSYRLSGTNGAFLFTTSAGERDLAAQSYGYTYQGVGFNAINQLTPITVPIYRLASTKGYLLTTSFIERANARAAGYRNEGITMYTYGSMNDPGLKPTYRLARSGTYFYTTSASEQSGASQYGFRTDGIGFLTP